MLNLLTQFDQALRVDDHLVQHKHYLAHRPSSQWDGQIADETLSEHMDVVLRLAKQLSEVHGLAPIVDQLVNQLVSTRPTTYRSLLQTYILDLFVGAIAFHDFGKVNQHFQKERMRNVLFQATYPEFLKPAHGHSELSAYVFAVYHLERIEQTLIDLPEEEQVWLSAVALLFTNPILLHHSSRFEPPQSRIGRSQFMKVGDKLKIYLSLYQFSTPNISSDYFAAWGTIWNTFTEENGDAFPILALLRLNFSLLTAADYLATSEYMNQAGIKDFGVLTNESKGKLIDATQISKPYNTAAFRLANDPNWQPIVPTDRNNETLNALRLEIAVQGIRQVRQNPQQRLFYLEAPTGGGKTNVSALVTAELLRLDPSLNKVFYVFPFTTLITQTHKALQDTWQLDDSQMGLLHSRGGFQLKEDVSAEAEGDYGKQWKNQLANLFSFFPVCLLTHIRFFDILKSNEKDSIYLMHRLANSVVVIDELQSYPPKHWDKMLFWLDQYSRAFNIRFVLMSATLPRIDGLTIGLTQRPTFVDLLPDAKRYFQNPNFSDRVRFRFDLLETPNRKTPRTIEPTELAEAVLSESRAYADVNGRVFTIIEFIYKKSSTEFANQIGQEFFDKVFVLSGTILEPRRREIINFLKRNTKSTLKVLLITTQVVEAGVDIDMDLGFKNISLIDSDEQLAGRVNRNVTKGVCNVFLFKLNEPGILYKHDDRFDITREKLTIADHRAILETKDFGRLYNQVLAGRNSLNQKVGIDNFSTKYLANVQQLDYEAIHKNFQLIEQRNLSVFVPLSLPIVIDAEEVGKQEEMFSETERQFLAQPKYDCYRKGDQKIDGVKVWTLYRQLNEMRVGITESQVSKKIMQGILTKFTFSIFYTDKIKRELCPRFTGPEEDGFPEYLYLRHYDEVYDYNTGLDQSRFESSENSIL